MLDELLIRRAAPILAPLAGRLIALRIGAGSLTLSAAVLNALAVYDIAHRFYLPALAILVAGRVLDALDGPVARLQGATLAGAALDQTLDLVASGALVFAFGLAEPERALAAMFLMLGLVARGPASQSLLGKSELYCALGLACAFPGWFSLIAYAVGILCFVSTGIRLSGLFAKEPA
ncbi:MAG: hypothetical protein JSR60_13595 [Proteobacteria bacterium]|nr:hypothetical protein [Pseudomonadota bacterium]